MLLEISQNSQENTSVRVSFLTKLQISACNFIKKSLQHRCFPVNLAKFLRAPFLQNTSGQLLFDLITYIRLMLKDFDFFFNKYQKQLSWGAAKIKSFENSCEIHWIKYQEIAWECFTGTSVGVSFLIKLQASANLLKTFFVMMVLSTGQSTWTSKTCAYTK